MSSSSLVAKSHTFGLYIRVVDDDASDGCAHVDRTPYHNEVIDDASFPEHGCDVPRLGILGEDSANIFSFSISFLSLLLFLFSLFFISSFLFILHFLVNFDLGFQVDVMASIVLFLVPVMSSALSTRSMMTCFVVNTT